jgi:hypothetical protein
MSIGYYFEGEEKMIIWFVAICLFLLSMWIAYTTFRA